MSLQPLEWRKLPVRTFQVSQSVTTILTSMRDMLSGSAYFDGSSRVAGSGSAWVVGGIYYTGSNAEALYCFPPVKTEMTQSVIFAGKAQSGTATIAGPYSASLEQALPVNWIHVACTKLGNSSSFTQWTSAFPYGSSSYSTGYAMCFGTSCTTYLPGDTLTIYESKEAIAVFAFKNSTTATSGVIAGAVVDPEQSSPTSSFDAEVDGRLYGIITTGFSNIATNFMQLGGGAARFLMNYQTANSPGTRFILFTPGISPFSSTMAAATEHYSASDTFLATRNYTTISGKFVKTPLKCMRYDSGNPTSYLGRLRDITSVRNSVSGLVIRDNQLGNIIGYTLGTDNYSPNDTILFNHS